MTFLEWLLAELICEPPTARHAVGESVWPCPQCGHERFHTMPDRPQMKHRAHCWRCGFRGDAADMLRWFHPVENETYPQLCDRLDGWRVRYELEAESAGLVLPRGAGVSSRAVDPRDVQHAMAELYDVIAQPVPEWATLGKMARYVAAWRLLAHAADAAWRCGVSLDELAAHCARSVLDYRDSLREHAATCTDPNCDEDCQRWREKTNAKVGAK